MKRRFYNLLVMGLLIVSFPLVAQKSIVVVEPDPAGTTGALNSAVETTAEPGNTIFELRRGGHYEMSTHINFSGYTLHIRAEAGDGPRPVIQAAPTRRHFRASGSLILESLCLDQMASDGTYTGNQTIRFENDGNRLIMDDCILDYVADGFIRTQSSNNKIYIKNSMLRNAILQGNPTASKIIETRGLPQDTISIENSTIFNCGGQLIDELDVAVTNVVIFNHNTVFQSNYLNGFDLGKTMKAEITNNLFYNFAIRGNKNNHDPLFTVDSIGTDDALRSFDLSNNNWQIDMEFGDILEQYSPDPNYTLRSNVFANQAILDTAAYTKPILLHFIENGQVDSTNNFRESLLFSHPTALNLEYWKYFVENGYTVPSGDIPNAFAVEDLDALDFGYNDNAVSATAAQGGMPLGDPRWIPYTPGEHSLTLEVNPPGAGTVEGAGNHISGTAVLLTATASEGYEFVNWTDGLGNEVNLTEGKYIMPAEAVTLTANFEMIIGVGELPLLNRVKIYPNPGNGIFYLEFEGKVNENFSIEVINILGSPVYMRTYEGSRSMAETIDLRHLAKDIYFVRIVEGRSVNTIKLVIK